MVYDIVPEDFADAIAGGWLTEWPEDDDDAWRDVQPFNVAEGSPAVFNAEGG